MSKNLPAFCNDAAINEQLIDLVKEHFLPLQRDEIRDLYELFNGFYLEESELTYTDHEKYIFEIENTNLLSPFNYYKPKGKMEHAGIDLPVYFNFQPQLKKIMIVAIDPHRSGPHLSDRLSLGTVFGVHDCALRRKIMYWKLVSRLAEKSTVYLTDTFKLFFTDTGLGADKNRSRSYTIPQFTHPEKNGFSDIHQEIFRKEVDLIKPDIIVTLGTLPRLWFTGIKHGKISYRELRSAAFDTENSNHSKLFYNDIPVLPLMHLSGRVLTLAKEVYETSDNEGLLTTYEKLIMDRIQLNAIPSLVV